MTTKYVENNFRLEPLLVRVFLSLPVQAVLPSGWLVRVDVDSEWMPASFCVPNTRFDCLCNTLQVERLAIPSGCFCLGLNAVPIV